jgi:hypothetical protein
VQQLYLRIATRALRPSLPHDILNPQIQSTALLEPDTAGYLYVKTDQLAVLTQYGETLAWLARITSLLFAPVEQIALYASPTHDLEYWLERPMHDVDWGTVDQKDPLRACIYEFKPSGPITLGDLCTSGIIMHSSSLQPLEQENWRVHLSNPQHLALRRRRNSDSRINFDVLGIATNLIWQWVIQAAFAFISASREQSPSLFIHFPLNV